MKTVRIAALALVCGFVPEVAAAQVQTRGTFGIHSFQIALPEGYSLSPSDSSTPGYGTFAYLTEARPDGSRGRISITLVDFAQGGVAGTPLDSFARDMVGSLSRIYLDWMQKENAGLLDGVPAKRIVWSGTYTPAGGLAVGIGGVSIRRPEC